LENPRFFNALVAAYNAWQSGFLPKKGGIYDQHACFSELMSIMYSTIQECDKVKQQRDEANNRVNG